MSYTDTIKEYLYESGELVRKDVKRRERADVRSGKMSQKQRVARIWSDAQRRGDTDKANALYKIYKRLEGIAEEKDWIQGAVKHPGRCTPMPNPDCPVGSPQYNLGKRFKKAARKKKAKGGTGWQGKV